MRMLTTPMAKAGGGWAAMRPASGVAPSRFVQALHRDLLGRPATRGERMAAEAVLATEGRAALVERLGQGDEALERLARRVFETHRASRAASLAEVRTAAAALRSGVPLDQVIAEVLAGAAEAEGVTAGEFGRRAYEELLGHGPTAAEADRAAERLARAGSAALALSVLRTPECRARLVGALYRSLLDRPATEAELRPWCLREHAGIDLARARLALLCSDEYAARWG